MYKAVFIDKDGTLIPDVPYNVNPALITLEDSCIDGLKLLQDAGYLIIIVSNQSGIALGYFEEEKLKGVENRIRNLLLEHGINLHGFYYCPHHTEAMLPQYRQKCKCRKPEPGMLLQAASECDIDLSQSWMIGDILNDVEAGNRAGCRSILIDNGNETEWLMDGLRKPEHIFENIDQAAGYILLSMHMQHHDERMDRV